MDKEYIIVTLQQRIAILKNRYKLACHGKNDDGTMCDTAALANVRHSSLRDLHLCQVILELVQQIKTPLCEFSDDATDGLEKLMSPIERHRRLRRMSNELR